MPNSKKRWLCGIIIVIILAIPTWYYFLQDIICPPRPPDPPGPIYFVQIDQKLKTVLDDSGITDNLTKYYKFDITEPALELMIDANRYSGKSYVSLLEDILSRNEDKIEYRIDGEAKVIFIWPKNQIEKF